MKRAIITGATGFVGTHLVERLLLENVEVVAVCRKESPNLNRLPKDVVVVYEMSRLPRADVFFHLAWDGASGPGRVDPLLQSKNISRCLLALESSYKCGAKFVGLGTVYERFAEKTAGSEDFRSPSFYILAKHSSHALSSQYAYKLGCEYVWCQICHPIGRYIKSEQLIAYTVSSFLSGNPPEFGTAASFFDVVAVKDVALGLYMLGKSKLPNRDYYIGSGSPMLLREYIEKTRLVLSSETLPVFGKRKDDGLIFDKQWFDITPAIRDAGYAPIVPFELAVWEVANYQEEMKCSRKKAGV